MPEKKVNFGELVKNLREEIDSIEALDVPQAEKTRKFNAAGSKFKNALYDDQRKYSGESGQKKRISLNTYNTYLSRARKQFEGLRHHLLDRDVARLIKRYPHHAEDLSVLVDRTAKDTRIAKKQLESELKNADDVLHKIKGLDFSQTSDKRKLDRIAKGAPLYRDLLEALRGENAQEASKQLYAKLAEANKLLQDLMELKVNHQVMYALAMDKASRSTHSSKKEQSLAKKKRSTIVVNYPNYIQRINNLLANPSVSGADGIVAGIAPLTFALAAATGRRPIELLLQGRFERIDNCRLRFYGQAKKRDGGDDAGREIYSLVSSDMVLAAIAHLRSLKNVQGLVDSGHVENETRSLNAQVNAKVARHLNEYAVEFFSDKDRVFKDTRSIYARICYLSWFESDPRWANSDDDVFFAELLGHDDETTQMHYKQFKIQNFDPSFIPQEVSRDHRVELLKKYDDDMPGLANGDAAVEIHRKVKELLEEDPAARINQSVIYKATGAYRGTIQRYMELCADALGIEKQENGRWKQVDEKPIPVLADTDEEPEESVRQPTAREKPKPRVTAMELEHGAGYRGIVTVEGETMAVGEAKTKFEAMEKAWKRYQRDQAELSAG